MNTIEIIKILESRLAVRQAAFAMGDNIGETAAAIRIYKDIIKMLQQPQNLPCQQACSKCGGSNINYRYRDAGERLDADWLELSRADKELIRCTCRTCQFRWSIDTFKQQQEAELGKLFAIKS